MEHSLTTALSLFTNSQDILTTASSEENSSNAYEQPQISGTDENFILPNWLIYSVTGSFIFLFILGFIGNIMVIAVILRDATMRNSTNIYLVNLAITDLAVILICLPSALIAFHGEEVWYLGDAACRFVAFLAKVAVHASAVTIVAISFERYYAICFPLKAQYLCTLGRTFKIICAIWIFTLCWTSPFLIMTKTEKGHHATKKREVDFCDTYIDSSLLQAYIVINFIIFFIIPVLILIVLYGRIIKCLFAAHSPLLNRQRLSVSAQKQRKQVVIMLLSVITLFFLSLLPLRVFFAWLTVTDLENIKNLGLVRYKAILSFVRFALYLNSAGNPILYNLFSTKFRKAFKQLCLCCGDKNRRLVHDKKLHNKGNYCYKQSFRSPMQESTQITKMEI